MAYPDDILLPSNAKKFGFVDTRYPYNSNWDINWSFSFALTGSEHGFTTFLTTITEVLNTDGGQYLGVLPLNYNFPYILSEDGEILLDNKYFPILYDDPDILPITLLSIAFDTTGKFALSAGGNPGLPISEIKPNSLTIRDDKSDIIFHAELSSLSTEFFLASSTPVFQTLRFRFANSGNKLSIDYKQNTDFILLTSLSIKIPVNDIVYPGFTFCSPISSLINPSKLFLKNFHTQGNTSPPTYDIVTYTPLSVNLINQFTTISSVSASYNSI
jgi:hypothetical protein